MNPGDENATAALNMIMSGVSVSGESAVDESCERNEVLTTDANTSTIAAPLDVLAAERKASRRSSVISQVNPEPDSNLILSLHPSLHPSLLPSLSPILPPQHHLHRRARILSKSSKRSHFQQALMPQLANYTSQTTTSAAYLEWIGSLLLRCPNGNACKQKRSTICFERHSIHFIFILFSSVLFIH